MVQRRYLPNTEQDRKDMLESIGVNDIMDLFEAVPEDVRRTEKMDLPDALSEYELVKYFSELADKNTNSSQVPFFLGAGTYDHHIPNLVHHITSRQEFLTAYVPYQPEVSQGELQAMFEWQTMICELTGMEVTNSGMYDGFNAVAEAANLAKGNNKKGSKVLVSGAVHPQAIENLDTYGYTRDYEVEVLDTKADVTDLDDLKSKLDPKDTVAVIVQYPNFFGSIEDIKAIADLVHETKAQLIVSSNPLALGKLEAPGKLGADMVVGDVQPFGIPMSVGGPHAGYLAVKESLTRKLPSRIIGHTYDNSGEEGFVMALSTREQHIRREKATSNYSSNQALFGLTSAITMSALGKEGIQEVAQRNITNAHYLAKKVEEAGFEVLNESPYFNEFTVKLNKDIAEVNSALLEKGYMGGYDASEAYGEENAYLLCATEKRTKDEMDGFVNALAEVAK